MTPVPLRIQEHQCECSTINASASTRGSKRRATYDFFYTDLYPFYPLYRSHSRFHRCVLQIDRGGIGCARFRVVGGGSTALGGRVGRRFRVVSGGLPATAAVGADEAGEGDAHGGGK
jgi:hypothetical protein